MTLVGKVLMNRLPIIHLGLITRKILILKFRPVPENVSDQGLHCLSLPQRPDYIITRIAWVKVMNFKNPEL